MSRARSTLAYVSVLVALAFAISEGRGGQADVVNSEHHDVSPPLREMEPVPPAQEESEADEVHWIRPSSLSTFQPDPIVQSSVGALVATTPLLNFAGVGHGFTGPQGPFFVGRVPPDTNGAVGATQYVQWVNTSFAVFNKTTGAAIYGPAAGNTLWQGFGGPCETNNDGDPIVQYDKLADRWVMTQFAVTGGPPFFQCLAVSTTSDATGSYNRYAFSYMHKNDYPKLGVWPDAYYLSFNNLDLETFLGGEACALDRASMLAGGAATRQCFQLNPPFGNFLPSDLDGRTPPPAGAPNRFIAFGTNNLQIWSFHVDWSTPANTTFTGPTLVSVAPFTGACGGAVCIPQMGTAQQLDSLGDRLMHRLAYRNFGAYESIVVNHAVVAGGSVGVRWYEVRGLSGTPSIFQQGTYAPDATYRWMGSIAMDAAGNMALGYSASSGTLFPAIRYTGRWTTDPPGTMQAETSIFEGSFAQTSAGAWGDYSAMTVDPVNDCTFWYTNEYLSGSVMSWSTRIASFRFPPPSEPAVTQVTHTAGTTTINWTAGSGATSYDVLRGSLKFLPVGPGGADEVCLANNTTAQAFADTTTPAVGSGFFYVIRGESPCGKGSWGFRVHNGTQTVERASTTCP